MLWVTPDLHEIEVDESYSEARHYTENKPAMETQGERQDMLASMAEELIQGLNEEQHFRKVVSHQSISCQAYAQAPCTWVTLS